MANDYDLVVVGGGPGGYAAAIRAAQLGRKVALVERERVGGTCLNWGCIPTKSLLRNAEVLSLFRRAGEFGISCGEVSGDYRAAVTRSRTAVTRLTKGVEYLLKKNGVTTVAGHGRLTPGKAVAVADPAGKVLQEVRGERVLLATGSTSRTIPGVTPDGARIITSAEAMVLESLPKSMVILGGGVIAAEFAYLLATYGVAVTMVEMLPSILPMEDREIADTLAKSFTRTGIQIRAGTKVERVDLDAEAVSVAVSSGDASETLKAEMVLVAVGRGPYTEGLGLADAGVATERGFVTVDENYRTSAEGVYAVGDLIPTPLLAHVAVAEGVVAVERMGGDEEARVDYGNVPNCIYCQPQVASVGLTEEAARQKGHDVKVSRYPFRALGKAIAAGEQEGLVKLVVDAKYGEILGAHIVGSDAAEMIAEIVLARTLEATTSEIGRTLHAHPTLHEAILEAALGAEGRAIHI
ncbi:MAG: dihydrolipoyl dehydrogenase [Candidatus Latescibacteria bacterium]|nr:dihydrolipoyl dehydrogenase [Candidatus Latescibacterota bacterium]